MDSSGFASVSISSSRDFSWVFFSDWLLTFFLVTGLIFYFNRAVAWAITHILEVFLWSTRRVKVDIQSIKFSPLGGRVFFKNLTYVDHDQTITVVQGTLTWRYWLFAVRRNSKEVLEENPEADLQANSRLPCRWLLQLNGLEVFMYNRTVSYNNLMEQLGENIAGGKESIDTLEKSSTESSMRSAPETTAQSDSWFGVFSCPPLHVKVHKGAIVAGNKTTQAILIASFASADGMVDVQASENPLDRGCLSFVFDFERLDVSLKPNILFAEALKQQPKPQKKPKRFQGRCWLPVKPFLKMWALRRRRSSLHEEVVQWKGLSQYLDADAESMSNDIPLAEQEYGKYTTLLSSEACTVHYFYDTPGLVPEEPLRTSPLDGIDVGNSGSAPRLGIEVTLSNSTAHYGPWAERQRSTLHQLFFPTICRDALPQSKLSPGSQRMYTKVDFNVTIVDDFIIRVPLREFSKNEQFMKENKDAPEALRPFGWLEMKMNKDSFLSMQVSQVASNAGYSNKLDVSLKNLEVRTSVNHDILLRCPEHNISADLGYPLTWDGHVAWTFLNESRAMEIFILREHIKLISDMLTDFGTGPPTPYDRFRPFTYDIHWKAIGYKLFLNVNDANIVNNPLDFNDNIYVSFQGDEITMNLHVPMDSIIRTSTTVDFTLETPSFSLVIDTPPWHTLNNFLENTEVGRSQDFKIDGSYTYYTELGLDLVDTIVIACDGKHVALECYGFVVKYIMSIKENYFGDFTEFKTLEEHIRTTNEKAESVEEEETLAKPTKASKRTENETDVHFSFCVEDSCIILPSNIYDSESNMALHFGALDIDIRFTNYYMDMQANITPAKGYYLTECTNDDVLNTKSFVLPPRHDLAIDGLAIHGHRMFGLPPDEPTSFCKWDITPGEIVFDGTSDALSGFIKSLLKLGFGYKNLENHLLLEEPELYDTTNVTLNAPTVSFTLRDHGVPHVLKIELNEIFVGFIDFTNPRYIKKISADVGEIRATVCEAAGDQTLFEFATALKVTNFCDSKDYPTVREKQNAHLLKHDGLFHRLAFFIPDELKDTYNELFGSISASLSLPDAPPPLTNNTVDMIFDDLGLNEWDPDSQGSSEASSTDGEKSDFLQDFDLQPAPVITSKTPRGTKILKDTIAGANGKRVLDYEDSDFKPLTESDPDYETDNFVLNFGEIDVTVCSDSLLALVGYMDRFLRTSMKSTLDDLQVVVLKKLYQMWNKDPTCINVRFVCPLLSLIFLDESWADLATLVPSEYDHIRLIIENPSMAACFKENGVSVDEDTIALHVSALKLFLNQAMNSVTPLRLVLDDLEVWSGSSETSANSASVRAVDFSVASESMDWLSSYIQRLVTIISRFGNVLSDVIQRDHRARIELLYQIAAASKEFRVERDPLVITRPAYIMRLSRDQHIRSNDSWKVIARLRHILQNLPKEWVASHDEKFEMDQFSAPETAMADVLDVFTQWRSWEFNDIVHSFVFKYVFATVETKKLKDLSLFEIGISETSVALSSPEGGNFLSLNSIELSGSESNLPESLTDVEVSLKVSSVKGELGTLLLTLQPLMGINLPKTTPSTTVSTTVSTAPATPEVKKTLHFTTLVDNVDVKLSLGKSSFAIVASSATSTALVVPSDNSPEFTFTCASKYMEFDIASSKYAVFAYSVSGFTASASSVGPVTTGPKFIDIASELVSIHLDHDTKAYIQLLADVGEDVTYLRTATAGLLKSDPSMDSASAISSNSAELPNIHFSLKNKVFDWRVAVVDPLLLTGSLTGIALDVVTSNGMIFAELTSSQLAMDLSLRAPDKHLLRVSEAGCGLFTKYSLNDGLFEVDVNYGKTDILIFDLLSRVKVIRSAVNTSLDSISDLSREISKLSLPATSAVKVEESSTSESFVNFIFNKASLSGELVAISVEFATDLYTARFENVSMNCYDLLTVGRMPFGDITLTNLQILVNAKDVPKFAAVFLDLNVSVKIAAHNESRDQSLQVESQYVRVMLHSSTVVKLMQLANDATYVAGFFHDLPLRSVSPTTEKLSESSEPLFKFSSVHMLSYGFCVGFIFDKPNEGFPGVIAGCQKMFFIAEGNVGKFSLISAFFSMANGSDHTTFFGVGNEIDSPNRAFLPNVQITYFIKKVGKNKNVQVRVNGEELDVKFLSSSVAPVEMTLKSFTVIEAMKKNLRVHKEHEFVVPAAPSESYKLPSDFTSIQCDMNFAGGVIKLCRWEDFQDAAGVFAPSFELKAPAVHIAMEYTKTSGLKDHNINVEVFTFTSTNTLHSTCVPVLYDLWYGLRDLGELFGGDDTRVKKAQPAAPTTNMDIMSLLSKFHLHFALHIDRQELSLSCEPSAKVQAVVGIDSIGIRLATNDVDESQPFSGVVDLKSLGASLQHSYSRAVSGSVDIDQLLVTLLLSSSDTSSAKVYVAGVLSKVKSYVNLKQLQDLDLFKDLWFPKRHHMGTSTTSKRSSVVTVETNENLVVKYQKASTTSPIAWTVDFMVLDVGCEFDLGQSLGVLSLSLDNFWAASRKKSEREQDLLIGLNTVALRSEGRFSGFLVVKDARIHSVIQWSLVGDEQQMPLVLLSAGLESIETKASFDYNVFLLGRIQKFYITVFNQVDQQKILQDKLVATVNCASSELYITCFAAANVMDIYNTLVRMRLDAKRSYKEDLKTQMKRENPQKAMDIIDMIATLRTELEVNFGKFLFHVYPGSLLDTQVLVVDLGGLNAYYAQEFSKGKLHTDLQLRLLDISVALSSYRNQLPEESLAEITIEEFVQHSMNARGGDIFFFPSWVCLMETSSKRNSPVIEYKYKSLFGGKVDIRWNLGSINFIREMWTIHARALAARLLKHPESHEVPLFGDEHIEEKIKEVEMSDKFVYQPIQPPIIEVPQLRDLGDATPPLEWFGLHRQSFPGLTHQYVILGLQKLVREVETQYGHVLGKASN